MVRFESVRTIIALAVQHGLQLHQMDVKTAFLNGELKEEVYIKQPEGFVVEGKEHLGPVSERRLSENSEYVNPEMRETLGFPFQKGRFVKPEKAG